MLMDGASPRATSTKSQAERRGPAKRRHEGETSVWTQIRRGELTGADEVRYKSIQGLIPQFLALTAMATGPFQRDLSIVWTGRSIEKGGFRDIEGLDDR